MGKFPEKKKKKEKKKTIGKKLWKTVKKSEIR